MVTYTKTHSQVKYKITEQTLESLIKAKLSDQQLEITKLIVDNGMPVSEVAIALGVKTATIYKQIDRIGFFVVHEDGSKVKTATIYKQIDRIEEKLAKITPETAVDTAPPKSVDKKAAREDCPPNNSHNLPTIDEVNARFNTQVARILYLKSLGCSNSQIASTLGITSSTVRTVICRSHHKKTMRTIATPEELARYNTPPEQAENDYEFHLDAAKLAYNSLISGRNPVSKRETLHALAITEHGGPKVKEILFQERAKSLWLLVERGRTCSGQTSIVHIENTETMDVNRANLKGINLFQINRCIVSIILDRGERICQLFICYCDSFRLSHRLEEFCLLHGKNKA